MQFVSSDLSVVIEDGGSVRQYRCHYSVLPAGVGNGAVLVAHEGWPVITLANDP